MALDGWCRERARLDERRRCWLWTNSVAISLRGGENSMKRSRDETGQETGSGLEQ